MCCQHSARSIHALSFLLLPSHALLTPRPPRPPVPLSATHHHTHTHTYVPVLCQAGSTMSQLDIGSNGSGKAAVFQVS